MKRSDIDGACLVLVVTALLVWQTHSSKPTPPPPSFVIDAGRAGDVRIGMTVDEVLNQFGREHCRLVPLFDTEEFQPGLSINVDGAGFQAVEPGMSDCGPLIAGIQTRCGDGQYVLTGLHVTDQRYRTPAGLGVSPTLGEIRRAYPNAHISGFRSDYGPRAEVDALGVKFWFRGDVDESDDAYVIAVSISVPPAQWSQCQ